MKSYTVQIGKKPYILLLLTGIVFGITSILMSKKSSTIDLHVHDTYFVITHSHVLWLLAILALVVWIIYALINKMLYSKALTWFHVIITILTIGLIALALLFGESFYNTKPRPYYDFNSWDSFDAYSSFANIIVTMLFVLFLGQIVFVINLIAGLFKRRL